MCGRYSITSPTETVQRVFQVSDRPNLPARYNVAPTQDVPVVRLDAGDDGDGQRRLVMLRWGLIPVWADDPSIGSRMINARSESAAEKPAFREAFKRRRCLLVADGFYEWQAPSEKGGRKQPYYVALSSGEPFAFAGLWERWRNPSDQSVIESCTILTTDANARLQEIYPRMPVMLAPDAFAAWLDPDSPLPNLQRLLRPCPSEAVTAYPISTKVNAVANDGPELIEPLQDDGEAPAAAKDDNERQPKLL